MSRKSRTCRQEIGIPVLMWFLGWKIGLNGTDAHLPGHARIGDRVGEDVVDFNVLQFVGQSLQHVQAIGRGLVGNDRHSHRGVGLR